jgi:hypothetical protein
MSFTALGGAIQVSLRRDSAGTCQSANIQEDESLV